MPQKKLNALFVTNFMLKCATIHSGHTTYQTPPKNFSYCRVYFQQSFKTLQNFRENVQKQNQYEQKVSVYQRKIKDGDQVLSRYRSKKRLPCIRHMTKRPDLNSCTSSTFMTSNVLSTCF